MNLCNRLAECWRLNSGLLHTNTYLDTFAFCTLFVNYHHHLYPIDALVVVHSAAWRNVRATKHHQSLSASTKISETVHMTRWEKRRTRVSGVAQGLFVAHTRAASLGSPSPNLKRVRELKTYARMQLTYRGSSSCTGDDGGGQGLDRLPAVGVERPSSKLRLSSPARFRLHGEPSAGCLSPS